MVLINFSVPSEELTIPWQLEIKEEYIHYYSGERPIADPDIIDCKGYTLVPGFIDLQLYGGGGFIFENNISENSLQRIHTTHLLYGTTGFLITLPTTSLEKILQAIHVVKKVMAQKSTGVLGLHLEGPFINSLRKGAHNPDQIRKPEWSELKEIVHQGKGIVKMITIAPELFSDEQLDFLLQQKDILVSAGHSNATFRQAQHFFSKGIQCCTHLYNAMSPFESRSTGLVGAALLEENIMSSIVADGHHVAFDTLRLTWKIKHGRLFLISDATFLDETLDTVNLSGVTVHREGDNFYTEDQRLAGSSISLHTAFVNSIKSLNIPIEEALRMVTRLPSSLIKESGTGEIKEGMYANLLLLDKHFAIKGILFQGRWIKNQI